MAINAVKTALDKPELAQRILCLLRERYGLSGGGFVIPEEAKKRPEKECSVPGRRTLVTFLKDFWNPQTSKYIREKKAHGFSVGAKHCHSMNSCVKLWDLYFGSVALDTVTKNMVSDFSLYLHEERKLSGASVNKIMSAGKTAFKWAYECGYLKTDLYSGLMRFAKKSRERSILTEDEARAAFAVRWNDDRARLANLVAMTTGLRAGEILALRVCDIGERELKVSHSWSECDGLKGTKNGKSRTVPLLDGVRFALLCLAKKSPHGFSNTSFIFYGSLPDKPLVINYLVENLAAALEKIGISEAVRRERNIVFHSWRHYYATQLTRRLELSQAQQALGHLTADMTRHYANHKIQEDFAVIERAVQDAFASVVPFAISA